MKKPTKMKLMCAEIRLMARLKHPNILRYVEEFSFSVWNLFGSIAADNSQHRCRSQTFRVIMQFLHIQQLSGIRPLCFYNRFLGVCLETSGVHLLTEVRNQIGWYLSSWIKNSTFNSAALLYCALCKYELVISMWLSLCFYGVL